MNDPRTELLRKLRAHEARGLDAHEAAMAAEMIAFVAANPRCAERILAGGHLTGSAWVVVMGGITACAVYCKRSETMGFIASSWASVARMDKVKNPAWFTIGC